MKQNKINPLDALKLEKERLKEELTEGEACLTEHWAYIRDNAGSLLLSSAVKGARQKFGFGGSSSSPKDINNVEEKSHSKGLMQGILGGAIAISPFVWEIAQPMLMTFAMKKVKSFFSRKNKKD